MRRAASRVRHLVATGRRPIARLIWAAVASTGALTVIALSAEPASAGTTLNGTGSSFAAPAIEQWDADVSAAPYSLSINYSASSSGQGRYEFTNQTTDFAVTDVGYVNSSVGSTPPSFPFDYIPIAAAGIAFMYNIPGLTQKLQLTSYTACLVLTGQVTNWDDPVFEENGANAGITLPNLQIRPVTEEDPAGTNYALEQYCIDEQPAVWARYAANVAGAIAEGVSISATTPGANWVPPGNGYDEASTAGVAATIASVLGGIGAVEENYAIDAGFTGSNPGQAVASVQNASGDFTQPTPVDVASALAYATQDQDGTRNLNFDGIGPNVYNPSTYSYLLTQTTDWSAAKGAVMSQYVDYVLTLGQQQAPSMGFASLGLSLERYGIDEVIDDVPGAVDPTAAEAQAYECGDLTPAEVQAGQTTPTCGVTNGSPPPTPAMLVNSVGTVTITGTNEAGGTVTAGTPFTSGQTIDVTLGANSVLGANNGSSGPYDIIECQAPNAVLPTMTADCDRVTVSQFPRTDADGSVATQAFTVYALPDGPTFDESAGPGQPTCGLAPNYCVLYVGSALYSDTAFPATHLFSAPFQIQASADDGGENPGDGTPESPLPVLLPLSGVAVVGIGYRRVRRDRRRPV